MKRHSMSGERGGQTYRCVSLKKCVVKALVQDIQQKLGLCVCEGYGALLLWGRPWSLLSLYLLCITLFFIFHDISYQLLHLPRYLLSITFSSSSISVINYFFIFLDICYQLLLSSSLISFINYFFIFLDICYQLLLSSSLISFINHFFIFLDICYQLLFHLPRYL